MQTLVVNLFGGPGTGKSTTCAHIFALLKQRGVNAEMATEYAKDKVWEGTEAVLSNQLYVFGKQHQRIHRLLGKVDVIVTDSPLLNSLLYYRGDSANFQRLVIEQHKQLRNFNVFLNRVKPFNPAGRLQTEREARDLDGQILGILTDLGETFQRLAADRWAAIHISSVLQPTSDGVRVMVPFDVA